MKYQVAGHKRKIQIGVIPYDVICEFDDLIQMYYMMDMVDPSIYDSILVIDTYTNEVIASRELDEPYTRKRRK
jgi:hypothetical protein